MKHDSTGEQSGSDRGESKGSKFWGANMEEGSAYRVIASDL